MKGSCLRPITVGWRVGSAVLLIAVAGQAWAATTPTISGKVTAAIPTGTAIDADAAAYVVATSDKHKVFEVPVGSDGTYSISPVDNGTYKIVAVAHGQGAAQASNVVISDASPTATQNFDLKAATPLPIVKAAGNNPIPLTDGIDSASFQDAPEIDLTGGENVAVPTPTVDPTTVSGANWTGPNDVSGRFKVKYSSLGIHIAGDVTYKTPRVNDQTGSSIWNANGLEVDIQSDPYDFTRTAYDNDHNWQFAVSLGATPDWWLFGGVAAHPAIAGKDEALTSHFAIQDKTPNTGETFRVDIPWAILVDSTGKAISEPADNALGALDLALDAADPSQPAGTSTAASPVVRTVQLTLSGYAQTYTNPSQLVPVQFVSQAPASLSNVGGTGDVKASAPAAPAPTAGP